MKIVYILPSEGMYGDNMAIMKIMPHLIKLGVEPFFVLPHERRSEIINTLEKYEYPYILEPSTFPNYWTSYSSIRAILGRLKRIYLIRPKAYAKVLASVKTFNPKIIHTNSSTSLLGYKLAHDLSIPHLWHIREYGKLDHGWQYFPSKCSFIHKINSPLNYSVCITNSIYKYFGSPSKGETIYDGVFDIDTVPNISEVDENYFLYVGRLSKPKGVETVIHAFLKFIENEQSYSRLKIAGTGSLEYSQYLKDICDKHVEGSKVDFLGYRTDVYNLMTKAKAIIVASEFEAFGFITAEAMYNGCAVIAHNTGGTKMQLDNGVMYTGNEIGLRYNNSAELVERMRFLSTTNKKDIITMVKYAQKTVLHFYAANKSANQIFNKYCTIIEK